MTRLARQHSAVLLGAVVAAIGFLFLVLTGVSLSSSLRLVGIVTAQAWAGSLIWSLLWVERRSPVEIVGMGLAVGTVLSLLAGLLGVTVFGSNFGWLVPVVVAGAVWIVTGRARRRAGAPAVVDRGSVAGVVILGILGVASLVPNVVSYPLRWVGSWGGYHADMLFFEALSTSLANYGPLDSIFSPDAQVRYHWLVYAWSGQVSEAAGAEPFVALVRVLPFVSVVGCGLLAIAWTRQLTRVSWAPTLSVVLLIFGGYVGATYGAVFNFDSPSQSLTMLWLLALSMVVAQVVIRQHLGRLSWWVLMALLGLLMFALAGGKISAGAIAVAGVVWLAFVGIVTRQPWARRGLLASAVAAASFVTAYLAIVSGSADPGGLNLFSTLDRGSSVQGLNPMPGVIGIILGTAILLVAISGRWAGLVWLVVQPEWRWRVETQLGVGFAFAGTVTIIVLSGGLNDTWFALAASAPLAVLSSVGVAEAWSGLGRRRWVILGGCALVAVAIFVLVVQLWLTGASGGNVWVSTWRWAGPLLGVGLAGGVGAWIGHRFGSGSGSALSGALLTVVLVSAFGRFLGLGSGLVGVQPGLNSAAFSPILNFVETRDRELVREWTDDEARAGRLLRDAEEPGLVATNVTLSPMVAALTGRQTLASGIWFQAPYGRPGVIPVLLDREKESWAFIDRPGRATLEPLCSAGVRWVWVDPDRTEMRDWGALAQEVLTSPSVILLELTEEACSRDQG